MINLPAREPFSKLKILFKQSEPPLGHEAKVRIRTQAKRLPSYRIPIKITPSVVGRNDYGEEIEIDTLGKWLFGVPGYRGHINVVSYPDKIIMDLYTKIEEALSLLLQAGVRQGLSLLYVAEYESAKIIRLGENIMKDFTDIWEDIRSALSKCGDIGDFNPDDFEIVEKLSYSWIDDKWPLGLDELSQFNALKAQHGLHTTRAQSLYASMARQAAFRLGTIDNYTAAAFGEFFGSIVSGWSGRFGNLDDLIMRMENIYCDDGYYRAAYIYEENQQDFFTALEVQEQMRKVFQSLPKK